MERITGIHICRSEDNIKPGLERNKQGLTGQDSAASVKELEDKPALTSDGTKHWLTVVNGREVEMRTKF